MEFLVKWICYSIGFAVGMTALTFFAFLFCKMFGLVALYEFLFSTTLTFGECTKFVLGFSGVLGFVGAALT